MARKKKFLLRIDEALWNELHAWAADELRSVNGQIEYVLREAVRFRPRTSAPDSHERESRDPARKTAGGGEGPNP